VLGASVRPDCAACIGDQQLHSGTDAERGPVGGDHGLAEPLELGGIALRPRSGRAAEDDGARFGEAARVDLLVVGHSDWLTRGFGEPSLQALKVLRPSPGQVGAPFGEDELDGH